MSRTRRFFDALNVPTCDGSSMCRALLQYHVPTVNGKRNEWTSNFSAECRKGPDQGDGQVVLVGGVDSHEERIDEGCFRS